MVMWQARGTEIPSDISAKSEIAIAKGLKYLAKMQATDGSWLPLWFGNQFNKNDENPLYGTAKVVLALKECGQMGSPAAAKGIAWLLANQNDDGGWSGRKGLDSSTEETGLAVEALAGLKEAEHAVKLGAEWLIQRVTDGSIVQPSPIGFYFAKLWYFEQLYPLIFSVAALRRVLQSEPADM